MPRGVPRYSVEVIDAARLALTQALADLPLDQVDVARMRKAVRAAIEAYERAAFEKATAKWALTAP